MKKEFTDAIFSKVTTDNMLKKGKVLKHGNFRIAGKAKIEVMEDSEDGVKIILNKDENDTIREIKFVCSCGQTKSLYLDYSDER